MGTTSGSKRRRIGAGLVLGLGLMLALGLELAIGGLPSAPGEEPISPNLTPKLRELLRQEMVAIQEASQDILLALTAGDEARVAERAQQIHDSFILKRSMTPEDRTHLMTVAPDDFVQRDRAFHGLAAELATAARAGDRPAQHARFGQMIEACAQCHQRYAADRFPDFAREP